MNIKSIATQRFIEVLKHIRRDNNLEYLEIQDKMKMPKNSISNLMTQKTQGQNRYVSLDHIYHAKKAFNANPLYILNLSNIMFDDKPSEINNDEELFSLRDKVKTLQKIIEDKEQIITLQKQLINNVANKGQKKLNT